MLAACGELTRLEREWKLQLTMSLAFMLAGFLVYIGGLSVIAWSFEIYYLRVLGIRETLIFFAGLLATTYIYGVASITRAHKVERFTKIGVCAGLGYSSMSAALCVHLGNLGIAFAYMTVTLLYVLPASYRMMNKFTEERKTV